MDVSHSNDKQPALEADTTVSAPFEAEVVTIPAPDVPVGDWAGLKKHWAKDVVSGFLVFLIALPLCLGIAMASGFPPIAGVFTAIVGGIVGPLISNSEMTIKGPAAGLIVIVVGCVADFGGTGFGDGVWSAADQNAYRLTLGVGVAAAVLQIAFGLLKAGILGEFFPASAVHGLLAAIGVIIMAKQIPVALGVNAKGGPIELILQIPTFIKNANPEVALIGGVSLVILFGWNAIEQPQLKRIPAALIVLLVSVPLALYFGMDEPSPHHYLVFGHDYTLSRKFLVEVPSNLFSGVTSPNFSGVFTKTGLYWVAMFSLIGTLESLLSAKAVELLDPFKRKTNLDRDNTAVGVGNLLASFVGGLPMISEIVRSRANVDNGGRTRFANLAHGAFLLVFVATVPFLVAMIPLAALGAMLVFTGFRLAHPREFVKVRRIGGEQLLVFAGTIVAVLATDLLQGIGIGVLIEFAAIGFFGTPFRSFFSPAVEIETSGATVTLTVKSAAVFSNWIALRRQIQAQSHAAQLIVDFSSSRVVDHTVMEKLLRISDELAARNCTLVIRGLEGHNAVSKHPQSARKRVQAS